MNGQKNGEAYSCTIIDLINQRKVIFDFPSRQYLIGHINGIYQNISKRKNIILQVVKYSSHSKPHNVEEYLEIGIRPNEFKIFNILKKHGIDINDFGIKFKFFSSIETKQEFQPLDKEYILETDELIHKYINYNLSFIIEPLIYENGLNIIGAERGSGKTRFCLCIACCMVYEVSNFLGYSVNKFGNVLFINLEMKESELKLFVEPINSYYASFNKKKHQLFTISYVNYPDLSILEIGDYIKKHEPVLIIVDSLKKFLSLLDSEKLVGNFDNIGINKVFNILNSWQLFEKTSFLITNHTNKSTKSQRSHSDLMFGPSSILDYSDHTFLLRKTDIPNQRILIPDKSRFSAEGSSGNRLIEIISESDYLFFELIEDDVNESDHIYTGENSKDYSKNVKENVFRLHAKGLSSREIQKETGIHFSTVTRWIKKLNT